MKNAKPIAIHLDRLAAALAEAGVDLKRSNLLEVVAAAFGHRTSNETSRLAAAGELTPPSAQPIGRIDLGADSVMLVRDAATDLPYAIAQSFLDEIGDDRSKHFAPTPYGGLADLRRVAVSEVPPLRMRPNHVVPATDDWRAIVQTGYGFSGHVFFTENTASDLATEIAAWCVEHWDTARERQPGLPSAEGRKRLSDLEVIQAYFEAWAGDECLIMEGQESLTDILETLRNGIAEQRVQPVSTAGAAATKVRDGRFRAYPCTTQASEMPEERDYLSSHDTLEEAIAACEANRGEYQDAAVADHVGRRYWRASYGWKQLAMPEMAVPEGDETTTFHLNAKDLLQHELGDELRRIADMVDNGFREGETKNRGWWWRILSDKAWRDANDDSERGDCSRCDSTLDVDGFCTDETCPFSDYKQDDPRGWSGHPEMDSEIAAGWQPPEGMTPLRAARIQHAILVCLENGIIDKEQAVERLQRRLGFGETMATAIVDGNHDGAC